MKSDAGFREYERQINKCIRGLCRHTKRVVTRKALGAACRDVSYNGAIGAAVIASERGGV